MTHPPPSGGRPPTALAALAAATAGINISIRQMALAVNQPATIGCRRCMAVKIKSDASSWNH